MFGSFQLIARPLSACLYAAVAVTAAIAQPDVPLVVSNQRPDLRGTIVSVDVTATDGPVIVVRVSNVGTAASGATQIGIESTSGAFAFTGVPLPGIAPSGTADTRLQIKGVLSPGDYGYRVSLFDGIDPGPGQTLATSSFTVPEQLPHIDLFVGAPSLDGTSLRVQVGNRGPGTAVGSTLRASVGKSGGARDFSLPDIASGERSTIEMHIAPSLVGTLSYRFYADPGARTIEDNPSDNSASGHITIAAPTTPARTKPARDVQGGPQRKVSWWWVIALGVIVLAALGGIGRLLARLFSPRPTVEWIPVPDSGHLESDGGEESSGMEVVLQLVVDSGLAQIHGAPLPLEEVERG